ncbi:putative ribonuclease H-like domain-containing protein [Tanacetum coccineum]
MIFAPVARIEVIRLFLAYASFMEFIVYQMDVKSAFLYGTIEEEVYVCQPSSFEDPYFPNKVYKVEKALYCLHQAPRAWYETLSTYLLENGYIRGTIDKTLFIKKDIGDILLVQRYVDDIIFGSTIKSLCVEFEQMMHKRFQISSMGELTFFLGLQVQPKEDGIFISQDKYVVDILKKFDFNTVKATSTPIETNKALNKDEEAGDMDVHLYRSMIGSLMYLTASRHDIMFCCLCLCKIHHLTWKPFLIVILLELALTGNPQQDVVNFLAKDETVYKEWENKMERAATTAFSLEVEHDSGSGPRCQVTILGVQKLKLEGSEGFHQIVDFLNTSHIKYALTKNPTIHVSLIQQFWQTAAANTLDSREVQITATIDGKVNLVSKASIRRHLKLEDPDGITRYFAITEIGDGSTVPVESHHTPLGAPTTSQPLLSSPSRIPTRQETKVPQPSSPTYINVADEAAFISVDVVHGGAATTVSSIDAGTCSETS